MPQLQQLQPPQPVRLKATGHHHLADILEADVFEVESKSGPGHNVRTRTPVIAGHAHNQCPERTFTTLEKNKARDRELLIDSREFASEHRLTSWWHLLTTLAAWAVCVTVAAFSGMFLVRAAASLITALTIVRMFILYHDYQHGAIFKSSRTAGSILNLYGWLLLTPPSVWRHSHNHHHQHNSKLFGSSIGTFPIMTTEDYRDATWSERLEYRVSRNPLVIVFGYFAVFMYGMCIQPLIEDARHHLDALLSLAVHLGFVAALVWFTGWTTAMFVFIAPALIATALGAYLFYIQHNFPEAKIRDEEEWTYTGAALHSSSFMTMGPVMHWMTGNIGYHHVHHLNAKIPFYRLPETMKALPLLQTPATTSWSLRDIIGCLRLKLWDIPCGCFVGFAKADTEAADAEAAVDPDVSLNRSMR